MSLEQCACPPTLLTLHSSRHTGYGTLQDMLLLIPLPPWNLFKSPPNLKLESVPANLKLDTLDDLHFFSPITC